MCMSLMQLLIFLFLALRKNIAAFCLSDDPQESTIKYWLSIQFVLGVLLLLWLFGNSHLISLINRPNVI